MEDASATEGIPLLLQIVVPAVLFAVGFAGGFAYRAYVSRRRKSRARSSFHDSI